MQKKLVPMLQKNPRCLLFTGPLSFHSA